MDRTKNPYVVTEGMVHEDLGTTMGYIHNDTSLLKAVIDEWNRQSEFGNRPIYRLTAIARCFECVEVIEKMARPERFELPAF